MNGSSIPHGDKTAFMLQAVELAERGKGRTLPNPCVGALLVRDGRVVARGWHKRYGGPHAEVETIRDARDKAVDPAECTLFVTLEPCNHHGRTPPCTEAVLEAGIRRVVVGTPDPNAGVTGGGIKRLRSAGVEVEVGAAEEACRDLIADFVVWQTTDRPYCYLKLASTLDGRIATRTGHSAWISSESSRCEVHRLRNRVQAVMVGGETFRADNPRLTCRPENEPEPDKQPLAVVVTSLLPRDPGSIYLTAERARETIFFTTLPQAESTAARRLAALGCRVWPLPRKGTGLDLGAGLQRLRRELDVFTLLCEGGGRLALSLVEQEFVDEFWLFLAPRIIGDDQARPLLAGREVLTMDQALDWRISGQHRFGEDLLLVLRRTSSKFEVGSSKEDIPGK